MTKAELLQDANYAIIARLLLDDGWVFQEKHNGDRRIIEKNGNDIRDYNRNGEPGKGLPSHIVNALRKHPLTQFIIDTELVLNDHIFVFDFLSFAGRDLRQEEYGKRESLYHRAFTGWGPCIIPVKSVRSREDKLNLIRRLKMERAEGFVAKELRAPYRPALTSGMRYNYRYKFVKDLDCVVIGDTTERDDKGMLKNSVRLGCYDEQGRLRDICGATKKSDMALLPGTVVKILYLYGTGTLDVVQPRIVEPRTDKRPEECRLNQIVVNKNWKT